uniref:CSD domain-containing protein n=1 Tax=Hyaloperonospora arabidopsidis (strain Emoy2) TaxID=559515 RepID=M4C6A3_HYAAE
MVSIKETFGFVSCLDREGDLFFHISEAPVDIQLHDEVEFRVKYNQRSDKDVACQLVALPKGTIKVEVINDEVIDGIVTKSLPRGGRGNGRGSFNGDRHHNREEHGLIEIKTTRDSEDTKEVDAKEEASADIEQSKSADKQTLVRREFVRFNSASVANTGVNCGEEDQEQSNRPNKSLVLHCGDEVRFRVAKHRKTGAKRAVDITIMVSARDKFEKEIEAKLATMTRESGVVNRVKNSGGFIKCCDRPVDVYFHFRDILGSAQSEGDKKSGEHADGQSGDEPERSQPKQECSVREGDEVSFFVYENPADDSTRSQLRLTAVRVQKLPPGTVSFENLLQADVRGLVLTPPKEPRNGSEVIGKIAIIPVQASATDRSDETADTAYESAPNSDEKTVTRKKGKDDKDSSRTMAFRLRDIEDVNYRPRAEDEVVFDEVLDKRTGKVKAAKIRVVQLNPKNRETGTVNAMKEDFGFIKCAERSGDAYFRFSDVTGSNRSFGNGTEVAFDIDVDNKLDHIRATRVQILPRGTVKWEDVVDESLEGMVVAVPSSKVGHASNRGGRGDKMKRSQKFVPGKISFVASQKQHVIDFLPNLKEKLDAAFIASEDVVEELRKVDDEEKKSEKAEDSTEIRILFPSTLSKFERVALHDYSAFLGLKTRSNGEGSHSQLEIFGTGKISLNAVEEKRANSTPELTVVFKEDDLVDVRYNPKVGDRVRFNLVMVKRTKELRCTSVACLEAAAISKTKVASVKSDAVTGEGCIISVKPEGFGFIQPAQAGLGSLEENLFFHIKDITTGQTLADLKEGTEVQYTIYVDEKKDKKRAMSVRVVPAGTIKIEMPKSVKGIVTKASFLQRMKGGGKGRFAKASNKASTLGHIMLVVAEDSAEDNVAAFHGGANGDSDDMLDEGEEILQQATSEDAGTSEQSAPGVAKKVEKKKFDKQVYLYNIRDIDDPSVVLREGDEIVFIPQMQQKTPRAAHVRLITSHAKQGVVTHITENLGGVICLDGEEPAAAFCFSR